MIVTIKNFYIGKKKSKIELSKTCGPKEGLGSKKRLGEEIKKKRKSKKFSERTYPLDWTGLS